MNPTRNNPLIVALLLVAAACGSSGDVTTSSTAADSPPTSVTSASPTTSARDLQEGDDQPTPAESAPTDFEFTVGSCEQAHEFSILCEAYDILAREFVDDLDLEQLAAGAAMGIEEFSSGEPGQVPTGETVCPLPTNDFETTCSAARRALATGSGTVDSVAQAAVAGMLAFGLDDPNSVYYSPTVLAQLDEERSGTISGIGSLVQTEEIIEGDSQQCSIISETCMMTIVGVIEGGPAEAAGLEVGDVMLTVDGQTVLGLGTDEVVSLVRGEEGTTVELGMDRDGEEIEFLIVRAPIVIPVTDAELLAGDVGYLRLSQFTTNSVELFRTDLQKLLDDGAQSLIIDFQNNPGGALQAAIGITSEFLDDGLVLRTLSPEEDRDYEVRDGGIATDTSIPVVVLVNGGSASASEVVAGALQEAGRATILGTATFGKNTVQQQFGLSNGGAIKVTIARWVTPNGLDFGEDGILPDVVVEYPDGATGQFLIDEALALLAG